MRSMSGQSNYPQELEGRLLAVRQRIEAAASGAGRRAIDVRLVVVTKTQPAERVAALFDLGIFAVGENRVQEFVKKHEALRESPGGPGEWHFIGHLQRNKVGSVVGRARLIHSADSVRLIHALDKAARKIEVRQAILLEVNVAGEARKTGAGEEILPEMLDALGRATHLEGQGLMTMAPIAGDPETIRPHFARLRELMASLPPSPNFTPRHLSMGMSGDFEVAIEEGSTIVRVGTAVMGPRNPPAGTG